MTLVNVWANNLTVCVARLVATIEHHTIDLPPIGDITGNIVRPSITVDAIQLTATGLTAELGDKIGYALYRSPVLTIEDEPDFAYRPQHFQRHCCDLDILAIPYITAIRRATMPDWYIPDERFC